MRIGPQSKPLQCWRLGCNQCSQVMQGLQLNCLNKRTRIIKPHTCRACFHITWLGRNSDKKLLTYVSHDNGCRWNGVRPWRDLLKITMTHIIHCFADCRIRQLVSRWLSYYWSYSATFWWAQQCSPSGRAGRWWMQPTSASSPSPPSVLVTLCREPPRAESAKRILWFWSSPAYILYLDSQSSPWLSVLYRSVRPSVWGALNVAPSPSVRPSRASDFLEGKPYEKLLI